MSTADEKADLARQVLSLFSAESRRRAATPARTRHDSGSRSKTSPAPSNASPRFSTSRLAPNWPKPCCSTCSRPWPTGAHRPEVGIVTSDPFALQLAHQFHFTVIPDNANRGETDAIEMATRFCESHGID